MFYEVLREREYALHEAEEAFLALYGVDDIPLTPEEEEEYEQVHSEA